MTRLDLENFCFLGGALLVLGGVIGVLALSFGRVDAALRLALFGMGLIGWSSTIVVSVFVRSNWLLALWFCATGALFYGSLLWH